MVWQHQWFLKLNCFEQTLAILISLCWHFSLKKSVKIDKKNMFVVLFPKVGFDMPYYTRHRQMQLFPVNILCKIN